MKFFKSKFFWVLGVFFALVTYFVACTHDDQVLNIVTQKGNELFSKFVTTPPTIDGTIDAVWAETKILEGETEVPNAGNAMFAGYIGDKYSFKLRSLYDAQYIYFLAEVPDANKSVKSAPWYFNPTTKLWAQEPTAKTFNVNGSVSRDGWGEDKMAFLWNIEESTAKFASQTCYASCHIFSPYVDFSVSPPVAKANANNGNHYTNAANEKLDQWWLHPNRGFAFNNMDDNYQDWAGGPAVTNLVGGSGNGRHFDDLVVSGTSATWPNGPTYTADASQGSVNNRQSLKLDGTGTAVNVPMWIVPDASNLDFLLASDTLAGGKAKKITATIREQYPKIKTQIQGETVRVMSAKKDELQLVLHLLKSQDFDFPIIFTNYH